MFKGTVMDMILVQLFHLSRGQPVSYTHLDVYKRQPLALPQNMWDNGWMTAERLHTITGAVVYFTALFILYLSLIHI